MYPAPTLTITVATPGQSEAEIIATGGTEKPPLGTERPSLDGSIGSKDGAKEKGNPGKKMQKMLKQGVHQGQRRMATIGKRIGHGVQRGGSLRRPVSTPSMPCSNTPFVARILTSSFRGGEYCDRLSITIESELPGLFYPLSSSIQSFRFHPGRYTTRISATTTSPVGGTP